MQIASTTARALRSVRLPLVSGGREGEAGPTKIGLVTSARSAYSIPN